MSLLVLPLTLRVSTISSSNFLAQMLVPPLPVPLGSPICAMKPLMFLSNKNHVSHSVKMQSMFILGMLGEAVKNPEMAQRYVNTHTHTHTSAKTYSFQKFL